MATTQQLHSTREVWDLWLFSYALLTFADMDSIVKTLNHRDAVNYTHRHVHYHSVSPSRHSLKYKLRNRRAQCRQTSTTAPRPHPCCVVLSVS